MESRNERVVTTTTTTTTTSVDDRTTKDLEDDLSIVVTRKASIARILIKHSLIWARYSLERIPIRMTLSNLGVMAVVLAIILPRTMTYILLYPIFRLVFGNLYPAYASYKAVRTKNVKEYVKWMMYWIVFALFTCAETFTDVFFSFWFPFYYEIKIILVVWLLSPATKGSSILYRRFVHPALIRREAEIDEALSRATEQGYTAVLHLGTKGVNYATTVLMQTAIKGGGGLVQHLRKSYSLSDLTGEKEDENRNTPDTHDETDMEVEPRRREHVGRRGYSPRRTQSSSNRVEMYFSEVDVDIRQPRPREPVANLTNVRSSDDVSSGYSSGEALQSHRTTSQGESLVRTSSVGARTRAKPRSTTKKTPEDEGEDSDYIDLPFSKNISFPSPLNLVTPDQALELLLLLSQSSNVNDYIKIDASPRIINDDSSDVGRSSPNPSRIEVESRQSSTESNTDFVDSVSNVETPNDQNIDLKKAESSSNEVQSATVVSIETQLEPTKVQTIKSNDPIESKGTFTISVPETTKKSITALDSTGITDELCQNKFDELKQLLSDAHKAVNSIVYSQEKIKHGDSSTEMLSQAVQKAGANEEGNDESSKKPGIVDVEITSARDNDVDKDDKKEPGGDQGANASSLDLWATPNMSRSNSDSLGRAGRYNKKPAPKVPPTESEEDLNETKKAPLAKSEEDLDDAESQNALKATLVIKTGTLKTFSNTSSTKDVFFAHAADSTKSKGKKSKRQRTKEGFSKLLTIPKNIFHSAFHKENKEKPDDCSSIVSEVSDTGSRSNSIESQDVYVELCPKGRSESDGGTSVENVFVEACEDREVNVVDKHDASGSEALEHGVSVSMANDASGIDKTGIETLLDKVEINNGDGDKFRKDSQENLPGKSELGMEKITQAPRVTKEIISDIF